MTRAEHPTASPCGPRRRPGRGLPRARRPRPAAPSAVEAALERTARGRRGRHPGPSRAGPAHPPGGCRRGCVRGRLPRRGVRSGDRFRGAHPRDAPLRRRPPRSAHGAHLPGRPARPPLDHGRRGRAARRAAHRRAAVDRLDARGRAGHAPRHGLRDRSRRALVDGVPRERGPRAAARTTAGRRHGPAAARPPGRPAPTRCAPDSSRSRSRPSRLSSRPCSTTCWASASTGSASTRRPSPRTWRPGCSPRPSPC